MTIKQGAQRVVTRDYLTDPKIKPARAADAAKATRVKPHIDPMKEFLGEPAPGQSALDKLGGVYDEA